LEQLTVALEEDLSQPGSGVTIVRNDGAVRVAHNDDGGGVVVTLDSGAVLASDHVFSTMPSQSLSNALRGTVSTVALDTL